MPDKNLKDYRRMARMGGKIWKKYGALEYFECVGDDMSPKGMTGIEFPQMAEAKPDETVFFSFVVYKSRADRDRINKKVMSDPVLNDPKYKDKPMPFDMKRMAYGGFNVILEERQ